jgi:hypothetical protein
MILTSTPVLPELVDVLHKASTYIDNNGNNPSVDEVIPASKIRIGDFSDNKDSIWNIAVKDPVLYEKIQGHIIMMQWNTEDILILLS